jgi:hypothetical protein
MHRLASIFATLIVLSGAALAQPAAELTGGDGTFYVGAFPNRIYVIDEATEQVVDTIEMTLGGPPNDMRMSADGSRMYMRDRTFEQIEVIDLETRSTVDTFTLSDGTTKVRIRSMVVSPDDRYAVLLADTATKQIDRFEIAPRRLLQVDLTSHEIMREIPWPDGEEQTGVNMLFSPDGGLLYLFGGEIIALDTESFEEVDRWELSRIEAPDLERFSFGFRVDPNEEPGYFTSLFRVQDPVQNRRLMGVARINLAERDVDFYTLGPDQPLSSFSLAPGRSKAYAILRQIGHYEFWTFDLEGRGVERREVIEGRPRMSLAVSTNGQLLYVHQAGATIDLYEASTYRYLRTISIDGDMTNLFIVPN